MHYVKDGTSIEAEWNFGQVVQRRSYRLDCYDEGALVGLREAVELVKALKGMVSKMKMI